MMSEKTRSELAELRAARDKERQLQDAAPDLLAALIKAYRELRYMASNDVKPSPNNEYFASVVEECRVAITKATT